MFGYVRISKADMTFKDYFEYKKYYCGTCKSLKSNFGLLSKGTLSYDVVFLAIFLSGINKEENENDYEKCFVFSLKRKKIISNKYIERSAYLNIILAYYKMMDNCNDEKGLKNYLLHKIFKSRYIKASNKYPEIDKLVNETMNEIKRYENKKSDDIESIGDLFGTLLGKIAIYFSQLKHNDNIFNIGLYLGKYIYLTDCVDDLNMDIKKDRYNPIRYSKNVDFDDILHRAEGYILQIEENLERLNLNNSKSIVENVVNIGLRKTINRKIGILKNDIDNPFTKEKDYTRQNSFWNRIGNCSDCGYCCDTGCCESDCCHVFRGCGCDGCDCAGCDC